jgi:sensor histidine kinase regulating citrate/malate metabolism
MVRTFKAMPLEKQIFFSFSAASALLLLLTLCLTLSFDLHRQQKSIDDNIAGTAAYIASLDEVALMLEQGYPEQSTTQQLERICKGNPNLNVIAIYDRNLLRFYHTSRQETGETYVSGEERAILSGAEPYIVKSYGTLGAYRCAFHVV